MLSVRKTPSRGWREPEPFARGPGENEDRTLCVRGAVRAPEGGSPSGVTRGPPGVERRPVPRGAIPGFPRGLPRRPKGPSLQEAPTSASGETRLTVERALPPSQRRPSGRGVGRGPPEGEKEAGSKRAGGVPKRQVLTDRSPPLR